MPPGELLARLTQMPRPFKIVAFPRLDPMTKESIADVALWPLTQSELLSARAAADAYSRQLMRDKPKEGEDNAGFKSIYHDAVTVELLIRACRQPTDLKSPAFPTAKIAREHVTANEFAILVRLYLQMEREVGPLVDFMSEEEMEAWVSRIQEDGSRVPLAFLASEQLEDLLMYLVSHHTRSPTLNGSSGTPLANGSLESSTHDGPPPVDVDATPADDVDTTPAPELDDVVTDKV